VTWSGRRHDYNAVCGICFKQLLRRLPQSPNEHSSPNTTSYQQKKALTSSHLTKNTH
jgi:hypothetical protein